MNINFVIMATCNIDCFIREYLNQCITMSTYDTLIHVSVGISVKEFFFVL